MNMYTKTTGIQSIDNFTVESEIFSRKACKLYIRIESAYLVTMNSPTKIDKN